MITHSIKLSHHLKHDISDVGVFCNISLFSVTDPHFESELYGLLHDKKQINQHLIFNFPQEELQLLNSIQIEKMLHLVDMGIRFCVDNIHNVLPDLSELSRIGISFIKIRPIDFVKGIYANHAIYKGKDIKEICQKANILLCVKNIDDHESLLSAVENQADLLQGDLLGEKERSELLESYAV
jgi:cyclic-di-GMP phosphodiesterase TipF (flagellum assembly factor)